MKWQFGTPAPESSLPTTPNSTTSSMPPPVIPEKDIDTESDSDLHPIGLQGMIEDLTHLLLMIQTSTLTHQHTFGLQEVFVIYLMSHPTNG